MPSAVASTDRVNSSREPVAALRDMIHGTSRRPTSIIMAIKATTLPMVIPEVEGRGREADVAFLRHTGNRRQQDQRQDHHQVFHNQPADGDLPALAVNQLSFL